MRLLDLFCKQGGAAAGYAAAGFEIVGVDNEPQPRYPYEFVQADALEYLAEHGYEFDAVHASPPCQGYSLTQRIQSREHPRLIQPTRELLDQFNLPWVIENVEDARDELIKPVLYCGLSFGLNTYRHRLFEANWPIFEPQHLTHARQSVKMGRPLREGDQYHAIGNFSNVPYVRADMGVPWMSRDGIRECVPPAYTELIGLSMRKAMGR